MWDQLGIKCTIVSVYVCMQKFITIFLGQLQNGDTKSMSAKSLHDYISELLQYDPTEKPHLLVSSRKIRPPI